jgi:uncharacterized membrane protein
MAFSMMMMQVFDQLALEEDRSTPAKSAWQRSIPLTIIGYCVALLISLYILWTFGRSDGLAFGQLAKETIVLGFPAALGAGAARLLF